MAESSDVKLGWSSSALMSLVHFWGQRLVQAYQRGRGRRTRKPEELEGVLKPQLGTGTVSCDHVLLAKPSQIDRLKSRVRLYTCPFMGSISKSYSKEHEHGGLDG